MTAGVRRDIQGVRGWAIVLVLLFHFFPQRFPNGYIGVDIFFVISGFLIAMILSRFETIDSSTFKVFYFRRAKRILPLYFLFIVVTLVAIPVIFPESFTDTNVKTAARALCFTSNIKGDSTGEAYEQQLAAAVDLFTHTWSLAVEIQFYFIVPILFLIQSKFSLNPTVFFSSIAALSLISSLSVDSETAFNNIFCRIWQFCVGIIAFSYTSDHGRLPETKHGHENSNFNKKLYAAYCILILIATNFTDWSLVEVNNRIHTTVCLGFLLALSQENFILSNSLINYVGDISYSLYLFHWPIYAFVNIYATTTAYVTGIIVLFAIVVCVYHGFETQYLKFEKRTIWKLLISLYALCVVGLVVNSGVSVQSIVSELNDFSVDRNDSIGYAIRMLGEQEKVKWQSYTPRLGQRVGHFPLMSNSNPKFKSAPFGLTQFPKGNGKYTILLIGNSYAGNHADIIYEAFKDIASDFNLFFLLGYESLILSLETEDYKNTVKHFKPDILFVMNRSFDAKKPLEGSVEEDKHYKTMLEQLKFYEANTNVKVYVLNAMPSTILSPNVKAKKWLKEGKHLIEIGDALTLFDEKSARDRHDRLGKVCEKCEIIDDTPLFSDASGHFYPFNANTSVMYFDAMIHITSAGLEVLKPYYQKLAEEFKDTHTETE